MSLIPFSEIQVKERLKLDNPWWETGTIETYYDAMPRRKFLDFFFPLVNLSIRRAVVLMGPRRVGKTVLLYHTIQKLLKNEKKDPRKIAYLSLDTPIYNNIGLEQLFNYCRETSGNPDPKEWFIFFDEIQYLRDWEIHLKSLVDTFPQTHFVASGSAAAALKYKSLESGAGRFTEFNLPPLTFHEFLKFKSLKKEGLKDLVDIVQLIEHDLNDEILSEILSLFDEKNLTRLNEEFVDYINYGGYPEVIFSPEIRLNPGRFLRNDILDKVILRDLPSLYGIRNVQELNTFFTMLSYNTGNEVSYEELSKNSGIQDITIRRYIEYLEAAFLIKVLHKISQKPRHFKRITHFKVYLTNPSLRTALFGPASENDTFFGNLVETAVYSQIPESELNRLFYARWQNGEVDFVSLDKTATKVENAIEIKWGNAHFKNPGKLKSLISFAKTNNLRTVFVTTKSEFGRKEIDGTHIIFLPASCMSFIFSYNYLLEHEENLLSIIVQIFEVLKT